MTIRKAAYRSPLLLVVLLAALLTGCTSADTAYLRNADMFRSFPHEEQYSLRFQPSDHLYITAFGANHEPLITFNILEPTTFAETSRLQGSGRPVEYIIPASGIVRLPLVGDITAEGRTIEEIEDEVTQKLSALVHESVVVTVRFRSYSVTLIGEVARPGMYYTDYDRINIFEALALAGDLTIYGRRDNVKIIREHTDGTKEIGTVDLRNTDVINSPFFYIEQDDVIYVEPNTAKSRNASVSSVSNIWIRSASLLISIVSLVWAICK